jgi:hypothetical protein
MKRKIATIALMLGLSLNVYAQDSHDLTAVMAGMENGLNNIQKGFLYNSVALIRSGVDQVVAENKVYHKKSIVESILPENRKQTINVAMLTAQRIDNAANEIKIYLDAKEMRKAHDSFSNMVKACTDCHIIVRGW